MAASEHITRITQALSNLTSQIFRCHGVAHVPANSDKIGFHDAAYWIIFGTAISGWYFFIFAPQQTKLEMLEGRQETLAGHLRAEKRELARLQTGITDLQGGDAKAWERAARGRLGWVEPGEITDVIGWKLRCPKPELAPPQFNNSQRVAPQQVNPPIQRPQIPSIPTPPAPIVPPPPAAPAPAAPSAPYIPPSFDDQVEITQRGRRAESPAQPARPNAAAPAATVVRLPSRTQAATPRTPPPSTPAPSVASANSKVTKVKPAPAPMPAERFEPQAPTP